jgi:trans-2,3-dihydro-3-hydroxyanthranilate isomerase
MKQLKPIFGKKFDSKLISRILNLNTNDVDHNFPIQEISTGLPVIIVPLRNLEAVKRARIDLDLFQGFIKDIETKTILIFSPETYSPDNDLNVRFFADYYGVPEDPATGSANGCLAAYLVKHRYFGTEQIKLKIEQGCEIGRPSLILLKAEKKRDGIDVNVGGRVLMIARGELLT